MSEKICNNCGKSKDEEKFVKKHGKFGTICLECQRIKMREHYVNNKSYYCKKARKRTNDLKDWFKDLKNTLCCKNCGENHVACLDFHHKNPEEKDIELSLVVHQGWSKKRILNEIEKCDVLCSNCHRKLHAEIRMSKQKID